MPPKRQGQAFNVLWAQPDAVARFRTVATAAGPAVRRAPGDEVGRYVILHELGLTLEELKRPQEAIQSYQRILDEFPQSGYRSTAQERMSALDPSRPASVRQGAFPMQGSGS